MSDTTPWPIGLRALHGRPESLYIFAGSGPETDPVREGISTLLAAVWPAFRAPTLAGYVARGGVLLPQLRGVDSTPIADVAQGVSLPFQSED